MKLKEIKNREMMERHRLIVLEDHMILTACPFCGHTPQLKASYEGWVHLECPGCAVSTRHYSSPEKAAAAWNRRTPSPEYTLKLELVESTINGVRAQLDTAADNLDHLLAIQARMEVSP